MSTLRVITNMAPRPIIYWWDLTPREWKDFDYLDTDERRESAQFVRYRGIVYDLGEFMMCPSALREGGVLWDGYAPDSFYSGVVVRWDYDGNEVIMGTYLA